MATRHLESPSFISENKNFSEYKRDLERWSRLTSIKAELQAETIIYMLQDHPSRIKEKIDTNLGDEFVENKDGIQLLLQFLSTICGDDDISDAYRKYVAFKAKKRSKSEQMNEFVAEWETLYYKCKNADCELPDVVLSFELLEAAQLDERETQLVLTGVDYQTGKVQRKLLKQMNASLKKLKGKLAVFTDSSSVDSQQVIKKESTYMSQ